MPKSQIILLRLDAETKESIEAAAHLQGQSVAGFILGAAAHAARGMQRAATAGHRGIGKFTGIPNFFWAGCLEASKGGAASYTEPAYHLSLSLGHQQPQDLRSEEWAERIEKLGELADLRDEEGIIRWFERHYPRCMGLVPVPRRGEFLEGVYQARSAVLAG